MNKNALPIAVFDSGVGGISVLRKLIQCMPRENFLYFGDSVNAPYGIKDISQVRQLTLDAAQALQQRGIKALVIACNTATSAALPTLSELYPQLIVVGIEPAVQAAADLFPTGNIGVMATPATLSGARFSQQAARFPALQLHRIPVTGLVELIEKGKHNSREAHLLLTQLLAPYVGKLDALVLGCTHYPFVAGLIARILGPDTLLLDGSALTAEQTRQRLAAADLLWDGPGSVQIENSAADPALLELSMKLLQEDPNE